MPVSLEPPSNRALWLAGCVGLWLIYALVFMLTIAPSLGSAMASATANVLPLALLALFTHAFLRSHVLAKRQIVQIAAHFGLAIAFATTWYALLVLILALFSGLRGAGFAITAFARSAFVWQLFQGFILYGFIAATCYAIRGGRSAASVTIVSAAPFERYLTRSGDEMVPVSVRDIVTITGAQDYAEVVTISGDRNLVRMSLSEFSRRLDPHRFLRIHRSTIINFDHLARTEPAGSGRMLAHMTGGGTVQVSRAGVQTLRGLVV